MAVPLAHVVFILDQSGSMSTYTAETTKAFNAYVETLQKCKGSQIVFTLIRFGDQARLIYERKPIQDVGKLEDYNPCDGCDVPYDAMMLAIQTAEKDTRASKVVICMQADGGDTSSMVKAPTVKAAVTAKRALGWEFNFMATADGTSDVIRAGGWEKFVPLNYGIPVENVLNYGPRVYAYHSSGESYRDYELAEKTRKTDQSEVFRQTAWNVGAFTSGRAKDTHYTDEQKKLAGGK